MFIQARSPVLVFMLLVLAAGPLAGARAQEERPLLVPGEVIVKFAADASEAARLRRLVEVEYAEPNYRRYINAEPNDPRYPEMYGLDNQGQTGGTLDADIDAPEAWDLEVGSRTVVVAVIDTGANRSHEDLLANMFVNPGEVPGNNLDVDGNGFVDDISGWDFYENDNNPADTSFICFGHGTHTAGTVGAVGNNGTGVTGVAPRVSIMALRAFGAFGAFCTATDAALIDAISYAGQLGAAISSNSWGGGPFSQAMMDAIAASRHLFVAAAGNNGSNNDVVAFYPASYDLEHVVSIAATDQNDLRAGFSNFGAGTVELAAPGVNILSTLNNGGYGLMSGTSMATPHVAGAAAVLLAAEPELTPHELRHRLMQGTDFKNLPLITGGRLNLLQSLVLPASPVTVAIAAVGATQISPGDAIEIDYTIDKGSAQNQAVTASLRAWTPAGDEPFLLGPVTLDLAPGEVIAGTFIRTTPLGLGSGDYRVIGRVGTIGGTVFDEDRIDYEVN